VFSRFIHPFVKIRSHGIIRESTMYGQVLYENIYKYLLIY